MQQMFHSQPKLLAVLLAVLFVSWSSTQLFAQDEPMPDEGKAEETKKEETKTEETPEEPAGEDTSTGEESAAEPEEPEVKGTSEMSVEERLARLEAGSLNLDDDGKEVSTIYGDVDSLWTCLAAFLVFFMQAGFAYVETGFTRAKNACNIVMKNLADFSIGSLSFWLIGFGLMFGVNAPGALSGWIGTDQFVYDGGSNSFSWAFLIFQTVFAATAATIVSGAMAERTKFSGYLVFSAVITIFIYPVFGHWAWGSLNGDASAGWLEGIPFLGGTGMIDFAGSTVVHSVGGWAGLAGAIVLGPRIGKFSDGQIGAIPGHNIPMAALGVFILWLGWFGFNPGSTTAVGGGDFAKIAVNTNLAAAAGAIGAMIVSWTMFTKPDPTFSLNGALAGLVAITAGCADATALGSAVIGLLAGGLVIYSAIFFEKMGVDDPVGAISVHGVCGAFGTIAIGFLSEGSGLLYGAENGATQVMAQIVGVVAGFVWAFGLSFVAFLAIKAVMGLRVDEQEELEGLDVTEHGITAYPSHLIGESNM